jgi:YVTN family beta-propeller protein
VLLGSGWRAQGLQVVDRATGAVAQTLEQPSAFVGLAFAPRPDAGGAIALYASGGNGDVVYRYRYAAGRLTLADSLVLAPRDSAAAPGRRYPAGLALSPDGRLLYAAENLADSLAVVDVASGRVVQRLAAGRYPYGVAVAPTGRVFVSAWGGQTVSVFDPAPGAGGAAAGRPPLVRVRDVAVARHPSTLLLDRAGRRLFVASASTDRVAVLDARTLAPLAAIADPPPARAGGAPDAGGRGGSTPAALALSADERRLYVAESDNNAVAAFALDAAGGGALLGRAPVGWYPTAVAVLGDTVYAGDGKGRGTAANPDGPQPVLSRERQGSPANTTLRQIGGTLTALPAAAFAPGAGLAALGARVARANGWDAPAAPARAARGYPPFRHVVYVIKENRTYDQLFGDLPAGDGDTSLVFFPRAVSPNHHALAERFGLYDRFFVNAEVSPDGHNWSTAAYTTDYLQKTVPSHYSGRGRSYDYEGTNRGETAADVPEDDAAEPAAGYLWDLARAAGTTFRNYGEFVVPPDARGPLPAGYRGSKPFLRAHTSPDFAGYDLDVPDQRRADVWVRELGEFARRGAMPALQVVRLPNDHTAGARRGAPTPRAYMADNDLALGRMVEALSRSPFWRETVMFVVEDDTQNGPDHVDSHRAPFLVVSAWNRPGVVRRFVNTTDVLATIEEVLGLGTMSQFDYYGRPLREVWAPRPDLRPYAALAPAVPLTERNTAANTAPADARASARLALEIEDQADEETFNRVLWRTIKGPGAPYPGVRRLTGHALALMAAAR